MDLVNALWLSNWKGVLSTCAQAYRSGLSMIISEVAIRGVVKNIPTKCPPFLVMPTWVCLRRVRVMESKKKTQGEKDRLG